MAYMEKDISDLLEAMNGSFNEETGEIIDGAHLEAFEKLTVK